MDLEPRPELGRPWPYRLLKFACWSVVVLVILLLFVLPTLVSVLSATGNYGRQIGRYFRLIEVFQGGLLHFLTLGWMFFLGGCLASFLNVVAWRLPRGMKITGSSQCPHCQRRLAFFDNLPFFGWLRNGGRCSQCAAAISPRYLVAEVALGVVFMVLGAVVFLTGGANWPLRPISQPAGFEHLLFSQNWELISILLWQLTLVCFLFVFALMESESQAVPRSLWIAMVGVGLFAPFVLPHLWLMPWNYLAGVESEPIRGHAVTWILNTAFGVAVGLAMGSVVRWATNDSASTRPQSPLLATFIGVGLWLGWQAVLSVGFLTLLGVLFKTLAYRIGVRGQLASLLTPAVFVLLATTIHLLSWRWLCG